MLLRLGLNILGISQNPDLQMTLFLQRWKANSMFEQELIQPY